MINPHAAHSTSLASLVVSLINNKSLIAQMTKREVTERYKGSIAGLAWTVLNPVLILTVYTFVFSMVFKMRWGEASVDDSNTQFALMLFAGIIVLNFFNEVLVRSPSIILNQVNLVKKVVFPLEVLPVISVGAALFHNLISIAVLLVAYVIFNGSLHLTIVFIPLILLPLVILSLGVAWMLSALGVFLRDIGQLTGSVATFLMFLTPLFYPVSAVPSSLRPYILANPLSFIVEQSRNVLILGRLPDFYSLVVCLSATTLVAFIGYAFFQLTRKGFADVL